MSGLNPRLFPAPLPFPDALHSAPAVTRTETLQGTSPLAQDSFVTAWPVTTRIEKNVR